MSTRHLLAGLLVVASLTTHAADWPRWRGPGNDGVVPAGQPLPDTLPPTPREHWRVDVTDSLASPIVAGGRVFHLDNRDGRETVHALDAATGRPLWSVGFDDVFQDQQAPPAPRCAPVSDGDRVYVQSCRGQLQCLAAADGRRIWSANYVRDFGAVFMGERGTAVGAARHGYSGAPLVDGARLIAHVGGTNGASVVCFDKLTGQVLWKSQDDGAGYAPPVLATLGGQRQVISFTATAVLGLDAESGALRWRVPVKTQFGRHVTTPVVDGDLVLVSSHTAGLMAIRVSREGDTFSSAPAWTSTENAINMSSFVVVDHHLYGLITGRKLACVDVRTGERKWAQREVFTGSLVKDLIHILVMKDQLLVLTFDGQLLLVAADPKECRVRGSIALCDKTWSAPAYADGRLYFRDARTLRCVQLTPEAP